MNNISYSEYLTFGITSDNMAIVRSYNLNATTIVIPSLYQVCPVVAIDYATFKGCSDLDSIVIGKGVRLICANTFNGCNILKTVFL